MSYTSQVRSKLGAHLGDGETVLTAAKLQLRGTDGARMAGSADWSRAMADTGMDGARAQAAELDLEGLSHNVALVVTDRRVLLCERGKLFGSLKDVVAAWPLDQVRELKAPKSKSGKAVTLTLADGRRLELEFALNKTDPELARVWDGLGA